MKFVIEKTDIQKLVDEVTETMQSSADMKDIKIDIELEEKLPSLNIDQARIKQVIINLVNNAIKFSPKGSIINIRAKKEEGNILFEVQDFGRGMPKNKQKKIFEAFYQVDSGKNTKFGGAGLGLSISRGIVMSHGGRIWVESTLGKGSTFRFTLPLRPVKDIEEKFKAIDIFELTQKMVR
jgi:signal transduction histidine kinase